MARLVKNAEKWHRLTIKTQDGGEMILMGQPKNLSVSVWCPNTITGRGGFVYISGQKALRTLARAILNPKPQRRTRSAGANP